MTEKDLLKKKQIIEEAKKKVNELKGEEKALISALKESGCDTLEDAEKLIENSEKKAERLQKKIDTLFEKLEQSFDDE